MTQKSKSDSNLVKMKIALVSGGLMATMLGAGLLGQAAKPLTSAATNLEQTAVTIDSGTSGKTNIDALSLPDIDLNLEAIPTVSAPTFGRSFIGNGPVARGHSSA